MSGARESRGHTRPRSLQARLLLTVLGLVSGVWLVVVAATWYDTRHELNELFDAHLAQAAALLSTQPLDELSDDGLARAPMLHKYQPRVAFQVWHRGRLVARSAQAPDTPLAALQRGGLSDSHIGTQDWRVFSAPGREPDVLIQVGERGTARRHILVASLRSVIWPMLLALPLLALGIWWALRDAVRPLRRLGQGVAARRPQALGPLSDQGVPPEVQPLVAALNDLFGRMAEHLASERRFTADAAHELRTPIAAIRMQAQVAQGATSEAERQCALAATLQGCDRATHLVEQLLQLARLEAEEAATPAALKQEADLAAVARSVLAELAPQALARRQDLVLAGPAALRVAMSAPLAAVLLRNLVDNALRYSPDGATVQVDLADGPTTLTVEDSGPGLSDEALARLGERFFRVLGTGQAGSGLGWSIVRRVARLHGLAVELARSPRLGGLRVRIVWPDAALAQG